MKKLIFTTLSVVAALGAFSQAPVKSGTKFNSATPAPAPKSTSSLGKATTSEWYEPYVFADKAGASTTWTRFVNFLFPDSTVKYIDEKGALTYMPGVTNVGQVLDPKDDNIDLTDNPIIKMTKYTAYTLDSIYFSYLYVRNVDTLADGSEVVDTLFIDYFVPAGLSKGTLSGTPSEVFATPTFNLTTRRPTGQIVTQTILLTRDDSTFALPSTTTGDPESSWQTKVKEIGVPSGVNVNTVKNGENLVAFSMKFKPGHDYDGNSVMVYQKDIATLPSGSTRANYFGYTFFANGQDAPYPTQVTQTTYYNNALTATKGSSYPSSDQTAWQGYIPGNAYFAHQYLVCGLKLTSDNVGINEIKNDAFAMSNVYPNPANISEGAVLAFNLKASSKVSIEIFNLMGQKVKTVANKTYDLGENTVNLNLEGMHPGVYFVNMTANGSSVTKKLTITE